MEHGEPTCIVCGGQTLSPNLQILLKCNSCGFVTARVDQPIDLSRLYDTHYFEGGAYFDYRQEEAFIRKSFKGRLKDLLSRQSGGRLMEIGAAYGFFLDMAREHFEVVGYEVNREAGEYARQTFGVDVRSDDFLQASPESLGGLVDVTVMWDVIEHLERPDLFIEHVAALSQPEALLYVTTGDIGSVVARLRGRRWRLIAPPLHLHYFSRSTLRLLLAKHGFHVLDIKAVAVGRSLRQMLYQILVRRLGHRKAQGVVERFVPQRWGMMLNTLDVMQVVARRIPVRP